MSNRSSGLLATMGKPSKEIPLLAGTVSAPRAAQPEFFWASANGHAQARVTIAHELEFNRRK